MRRAFGSTLTRLAVVASALLVGRLDLWGADESVTLFSAAQSGCPIILPAGAGREEQRAAEWLQATLAKAAGRRTSAFPIRRETGAVVRPAVYLGATRRDENFLRPVERFPFDTAVGIRAGDGTLEIRSERRESIEAAVGWFLERHLKAYWFMPGPLGEQVSRRDALVVAVGTETVRPGFVSRELGSGAADYDAWSRRNRLEARFEHRHNFTTIFRPEDFRRQPEMAPMRSGQRYFPTESDANWQPDLLSPEAVAHAAEVVNRAFDADPQRRSFSLSANDSVRFDDSAATLAAVAPARYFRHRPDYSDLSFGFTNAVAGAVAERHPDCWLPAYAYYWAENTPSFPVARHVVPFLTADRSQWSRPDFAREDRELIERWCRSGAEVVGVYDYFYGAPFLCPRPTLYAVRESIPFQHGAGVRAYFAETNPNWALDGPKLWLAAQLLWDPVRNPEELLTIYWREFWAEAAGPMQEFFAICERTWRQQPGPARWLRYYQDEDQTWIFPPEQRAQLRAELERAAGLARSEIVRARVAFVSAGLGVSEAFWRFGGARDSMSRMARVEAEPAALRAAWQEYREARREFSQRHAAVRRSHPLAVAPQALEIYLRNQPDSRAAMALAGTEKGRAMLRAAPDLLQGSLELTVEEIASFSGRGVEVLRDADWRDLSIRPVGKSTMFDWTESAGSWRGQGEPWEGRTVELGRGGGGPAVLRFAGCRTDGIGQWVPVTENALHVARVDVRARSSPGTATFLIVTFLDDQNQHIGLGRVDRLPAGNSEQAAQLALIVRAPPGARFIGFGVRVLNQVEGDFAEFSGASLRRVDP